MGTETQLRRGVLFRADAARGGVIELAAGRRFEGVYFYGTVTGTSDSETLAQVQVLGAVYPASPNQIAMRERLPALAVVPVATEYLRSDRDILSRCCAAVGRGSGGCTSIRHARSCCRCMVTWK